MKKQWIAIIGTGALVIGIATVGIGIAESDDAEVRDGTIRIEHQTEADFPGMAELTSTQAVQNALEAVAGQVLKVELEDEDGFLVYGVEVVTADKEIMEVMVDAGSGKVLAMERDQVDEDHSESGQDEDSDRDAEE